jgi:hypothetical protein
MVKLNLKDIKIIYLAFVILIICSNTVNCYKISPKEVESAVAHKVSRLLSKN